jgi:hypothetical protein
VSRRPAIILDMDETLLHTREGRNGELVFPSVPRPGLVRTLNILEKLGDLYVLSAGTPDYIPDALRSVRLGSRFAGKAWSSRVPLNLQRELGLQGRRWVLVDDTPCEHPRTRRKLDICGSRDRRRFVWISPFTGDRRDIALAALPPLVALSLAVQPSPPRRGR